MSQERFADECRAADIVFDQLGASALGMAGLDAMALARPVIANGRPEVLAPYFGYETPICQAATPDEVAFQLKRLVFNPLERESVGKASRKYVEEYFSTERAARLCLERLSSI